jgi:DHA2 family multidrug resistance protein
MADAAIAGAAFWVFAVHSLTSPAPFLDPRLLLNRNFAIGLLIAFFMGMLAYTSLVLFPSLLHDLRGYPDAAIGELLAARGIGNWMAFLVVVPIGRRLPRFSVALGLSAQSFSAWSMAQLNLNLTSYDVFWTNALQGFGFGLAFTPMTVLAFATLPASRLTEASGVFTLVRNFGSSLYISLSVVLLIRSSGANYARLIEAINPFNLSLKGPAAPSAWNIGTTSGLMRLANEVQRQASMIGYINAFYLLALTAAIAVPLVWLMRARPLETS